MIMQMLGHRAPVPADKYKLVFLNPFEDNRIRRREPRCISITNDKNFNVWLAYDELVPNSVWHVFVK
jgi:hypothetical protein